MLAIMSGSHIMGPPFGGSPCSQRHQLKQCRWEPRMPLHISPVRDKKRKAFEAMITRQHL
jgi:hypothetical protein